MTLTAAMCQEPTFGTPVSPICVRPANFDFGHLSAFQDAAQNAFNDPILADPKRFSSRFIQIMGYRVP